jgi:hypothetical protein
MINNILGIRDVSTYQNQKCNRAHKYIKDKNHIIISVKAKKSMDKI